MSNGIPLHCGKTMQYNGRVKIRGKWYLQYECKKCGKIKNIKAG